MRVLILFSVVIASVMSCLYLGSSNKSKDSSSLNYNSPTIGLLVYVSPGSFQYSANTADISTITTAFRISETEITSGQFTSVAGLPDPSSLNSSTSHPVNSVMWYNTLVFCNRLSMMENLTPVYTINGSTDPTTWGTPPTTVSSTNAWDNVIVNWTANGYRLPTVMEWLWAAMGATSGSGYSGSGIYTAGYSKAFAGSDGSNSIGDYVWNSENSNGAPHPVKTKMPNELGLHDMSGNIAEWCWDWADSSPIGSLSDYKGPTPPTFSITNSSQRVTTGLGFLDPSSMFTSLINNLTPLVPKSDSGAFGFRVVRL